MLIQFIANRLMETCCCAYFLSLVSSSFYCAINFFLDFALDCGGFKGRGLGVAGQNPQKNVKRLFGLLFFRKINQNRIFIAAFY